VLRNQPEGHLGAPRPREH